MEELLGDEYYVELFAEIADSEPITEAIDEVRAPCLNLKTRSGVLGAVVVCTRSGPECR